MSQGRAPAAQSRPAACADPGPHSLPVGPRTREEVSGTRWMAAGVRPPSPAGQMRIPLGLGDELRDLLCGGRRLAPGTRPRGSHRSCGRLCSDQARLAHRHGRGRSGRLSGPPPRARGCPALASVEVRAGVAPGRPRPPSPRTLARPDLLHRGSASPHPPLGAAAAPSPGSGAPGALPARTGRLAFPGAGQPGRPLLEGGFPAESARPGPPRTPPQACAARTRLGGFGRRREMPAPEREGVGRDGNRGEQERGLRREAERRSRKGGKERGGRRKDAEGWGAVLRPGPFTGLSLVRLSPDPRPRVGHPTSRCLPQGWLPDQGHTEVRGSPEATTGPVGKEGTRNFHWSGSEVG